jgi:UDP-N-acetylmuramoylalanine--D-glutamate ligase
MRITELNNQSVCILGYGIEGRATLKAIQAYAPSARITIADERPDINAEGVNLHVGPQYLDGLEDYDVVIKSSGIPMQTLGSVASRTTTATEIFLESVAGTGAVTIGVTGSKGKSTTATLIAEVLKTKSDQVYLVGNIGIPALSYLGEAIEGAYFVMEMSSYQLADVHCSPHIAVITSFFPEHLNYHKTVEAYFNAKRNIAAFQTPKDVVLYNMQSAECKNMADASPGERIAFSAQDIPLSQSDVQLPGKHNLANMAAAYKVALLCGCEAGLVLEVLKSVKPLPHRLQSLGVQAGIEWIDDSIATAPEAVIAALDALAGKSVRTIILGGFDRGYDYDRLGQRIAKSDITHVILFPTTGERIKDAILKHEAREKAKQFFETESMHEAVVWAAGHTPRGSTCLLSNGAPSYNLFKNFEERGRLFSQEVEALKRGTSHDS